MAEAWHDFIMPSCAVENPIMAASELKVMVLLVLR